MSSEEVRRHREEVRQLRAADATDRGQRIQVALAEFNALRSELDDRASAQNALITLVVTAIGIVAGFVIKDDGDPRLLLILPVLVSAAGIHHAEQTRAIKVIGTYIRDLLWPYLRQQLGEAGGRMPSWEALVIDFRSYDRHRKKVRVWLSYTLSSAIPGLLIFLLGSVVPLVIVHFAERQAKQGEPTRVLDPPFDPDIYRGVWWLGVALTLIYVWLGVSAPQLSKPLGETLTRYPEVGEDVGEQRPRETQRGSNT